MCLPAKDDDRQRLGFEYSFFRKFGIVIYFSYLCKTIHNEVDRVNLIKIMGRITEITKKQAIARSCERATAALPATKAAPLFTVTGNIIVVDIVGEVTTVIQTQANATKLVANPTVGADVDMCATLDITAKAVGSTMNITGTLANAMVNVPGGAGVAQAGRLIVHAGMIDLNCAATNTGSIKWTLHWIPLTQDANVVAA